MSTSTYKLLVDALVAFHFGFVAFVITGGLLVLRWRRVMWLHLPAVAWGIWIELSGGICPLTPLENRLRGHGGQAGYAGSFVDHYIMPVLYPEGLTRNLQFTIAGLIVLINGACYGYLLWRRRRRQEVGPVTKPGATERSDNGAVADLVPTGDPDGTHATP